MREFVKSHQGSVAAALIFAILLPMLYFGPRLIKPKTSKPASVTAPIIRTAPQTDITKLNYAIQNGDRLWLISKASCGNASMSDKIAAMNGIKDPHWIYPGKDFITTLPEGCTTTFTPRRIVMANRIRSATAETADEDADTTPSTTPSAPIASAYAIQWPAPVLNANSLPNPFATPRNIAETTNDATALVTPTAQDNPSSAAAPPVTNVEASKGFVWYEIQIAPTNLPAKLDVQTGTFPAFLVKNQKPKTKATRPKWSLKLRTGIIVTRSNDGTTNLFVETKNTPSKDLAVAFVDGDGQPFVFHFTNGQIVEFAPSALPSAKETDYTVLEHVFPLQKNRIRTAIRALAPLSIATGIGFVSGGPLGVIVSDGFYAASATLHHFAAASTKHAKDATTER
jgi:hypothetical protein